LVDRTPKAAWVFYETRAGTSVVRDEVRDILGGKPPRVELGKLMTRIHEGKVLRRDVRYLGSGLSEARLTYASDEYRLYFSSHPEGQAVLLGLKFHQKGSQGAQNRNIAVARDRLADWLGRI
jgi:phage-related protein